MSGALARAPAIPETAREPLFFFGTLLDLDVLALVTGSPDAAAALEAASIEGFARRRVQGRSYPLLVATPGACTAGMIWRGAGPLAIRRLNAYEGPEYAAELRAVRTGGGAVVPAWTYVAGAASLVASDEPWELSDWQARHKALFMARGEDLIGSVLP